MTLWINWPTKQALIIKGLSRLLLLVIFCIILITVHCACSCPLQIYAVCFSVCVEPNSSLFEKTLYNRLSQRSQLDTDLIFTASKDVPFIFLVISSIFYYCARKYVFWLVVGGWIGLLSLAEAHMLVSYLASLYRSKWSDNFLCCKSLLFSND